MRTGVPMTNCISTSSTDAHGRNLIRLTLGCWDYDRVQPLMTAACGPTASTCNFLNMIVEETFFRMLRHREFDVSEMSMSSYVVSLFKPDRPFVAIPVFPSRGSSGIPAST